MLEMGHSEEVTTEAGMLGREMGAATAMASTAVEGSVSALDLVEMVMVGTIPRLLAAEFLLRVVAMDTAGLAVV